MKIEEIIGIYGKTDYMDMNTYNIYKISEAVYNPILNESLIPVSDPDGNTLGQIRIDGKVEDYV